MTGVQYSINGTDVSSGIHFEQPGTYTVAARAKDGFVLVPGTWTWTTTLNAPSCSTSPAATTPAAVTSTPSTPAPSLTALAHTGGGDATLPIGLAALGVLGVGAALVLLSRPRKGRHV